MKMDKNNTIDANTIEKISETFDDVDCPKRFAITILPAIPSNANNRYS